MLTQPGPGGKKVHPGKAQAAINPALGQFLQEIISIGERGHLHVCPSDLERMVSVASRCAKQSLFGSPGCQPTIMARQGTASIKDLHAIQSVPDTSQRPHSHRLASHTISGVGDADDTPLITDTGDSLLRREPAWHLFFQKEAQ